MLLDTTIFIDFLKGKKKIKEFLEKEKNLFTSVVVLMEILAGLKGKKQAKSFEKFLAESLITVYHINKQISSLALDLFKDYFYSSNLGIADSIIAATAIVYKEKLVTANIKHFKPVKNLKTRKM